MSGQPRPSDKWPSALPSLSPTGASFQNATYDTRIPPQAPRPSRANPLDMTLTLDEDNQAPALSERFSFDIGEGLVPELREPTGIGARTIAPHDATGNPVKLEAYSLETELLRVSEKDAVDEEFSAVEKDGKKVTARILRTREMALKARQKAKERTARLEAENAALKVRAESLRTENTELLWQIDMLFQRVEGRERRQSDLQPDGSTSRPP